MGVSFEDLREVWYLKIDELDDRTVPLQPCYLGNSNWEDWFPTESGLIRLPIVDVEDGCYFSSQPASEQDIHFRFISEVIKKAYWPDLVHFERGILEDIHNLASSVSKINLFHKLWLTDKTKITSRYVTTELEYIFIVCRSLFDLLQEVIQKIWTRFRYVDSNKSTKKLESTFSKMLFKANMLSTAAEISERYLIPPPLAEFYCRHSQFFMWLRSYRDRISHGGNSIQTLYITAKGFAVPTSARPFSDLNIWNKTVLQENGLGSVRTLVAHVILSTLEALDDFTSTIGSIMQLPPDIAPNHEVYVRGKDLKILQDLKKYMIGDEWV